MMNLKAVFSGFILLSGTGFLSRLQLYNFMAVIIKFIGLKWTIALN
jgi:hypothetical protein